MRRLALQRHEVGEGLRVLQVDRLHSARLVEELSKVSVECAELRRSAARCAHVPLAKLYRC